MRGFDSCYPCFLLFNHLKLSLLNKRNRKKHFLSKTRKKTINFNRAVSLKFNKVVVLPKQNSQMQQFTAPSTSSAFLSMYPAVRKFKNGYERIQAPNLFKHNFSQIVNKSNSLRLKRQRNPKSNVLNWSRKLRRYWTKYTYSVSHKATSLVRRFFKRSSLIRRSVLSSKLYSSELKTWQKKTTSSTLKRRSKILRKLRVRSKYPSRILKSNTCVQGLNYRNLGFKWVKSPSNNFLGLFNSNLSFMVSDISNYNSHTRHFQSFLKTKHLQSSFLWLELYKSISDWFYLHSSFFYNFIQLNKHVYTNTSVTHISYFFQSNQLSHISIPDLDKITSNTLPGILTEYKNQRITQRNLKERNVILLFIDKKSKRHEKLFKSASKKNTPSKQGSLQQLLKSRNRFHRVLFLLARYFHHLTLSKILRSKNRKKTCIFFLPKSMFFNKQLITINEQFRSYNLSAFSTTPIIRHVFSNKGFKWFNQHLLNDNLLEQSTDFMLRAVTSSRTEKTILQVIQGLGVELRNHSTRRSKLHVDQYKHHSINTPQLANLSLTPKTNPIKYSKARIVLGDAALAPYLYKSPLLFKYFLWNRNTLSEKVSSVLNKNSIGPVLLDLTKLNFSARSGFYQNSNLWPATMFKYTVKRKLLKMFNYYKFLPNVTMWYYNMLIRFMENCSGKKVYLKFNPFIENSLTFVDIARCRLWSMHTNSFQRMLGHRIFVNEALELFTLALKFKDPAFLANWIKQMLYRMSFWKYRLLFRYIKYMLRHFFWTVFPDLDFKGFKLKLKGKISVAGNARTRTLAYKIGETGYSRVNNRVLSDFTTVNTFTGVMGFRLWFFW